MDKAKKYIEWLHNDNLMTTDILSRINKITESEEYKIIFDNLYKSTPEWIDCDTLNFGLVIGILFEKLKQEGQL